MKQIIVKVNGKTQTEAQATVITKDGQPTIIKAQKGVNYELINSATGRAPDHIVTKRSGKDLHVSFEENGNEADLIIEGYYEAGDTGLIGLAEDGQYYYYIPDTGEIADYVTQLAPGDIEGQALGGNAYGAPWWVEAAPAAAGFNALPWLVGLAGLAAVGAAIAKDDDRGSSQPVAPTAPAPMVTADDNGSVTVTPAPNATTVNINFTNENGAPVNLVVSKDPAGNWVVPNAPQGVVVNPATGVVTIPAPAIKDGSTVIGTQTTPQGASPAATATVDGSPVSVDLTDGGKIVAISTADNATSVTVNYTDANGKPQTVVIDKITNDKGEKVWAVKSPFLESNGDLIISVSEIQPGTEVTAKQTTPIRSTTDSTTVIGLPSVDANPADGSVTVTPSPAADKVVVDFNDEMGNPVTVTASKDPQGKWTIPNAPEGVSIDPATGVITIPANNVADGKPVTATQTTPNGTSDPVTVTAPADPVAVTPNKDGSVTVTPSPAADKVVVDFNDENDQPVTVTASKDPATGTWTLPEGTQPGVTVDPVTGVITIPANNVADGMPVKAVQTGPNVQPTTGEATAPKDPTDIAVDAAQNGSVTVTPAPTADKVTVEFNDEAGRSVTVTAGKDPEGNWTIPNAPTGVTIDPTTGVITISPNTVADGTPVKATQLVGNTPSSDTAITSEADLPDPASPDINANNDSSITVTPVKDATGITANFTDEAGQPVTVTASKDPATGTWTLPEGTQPGVTIDPATGVITIPANNVADGKPVTATQTTPNGTSDPVTVTAPADPVAVTPNKDGSVTVTPSPAADKVVVDFNDENDQPVTVTASKDPATGTWTLPEGTQPGVTIDPATGVITIPANNVADGTPVKAVQTGPNGQVTNDEATAPNDPVEGDNTPPALNSVVVLSSGKHIALSYTEEGSTIDKDNLPTPNSFTVTVGEGNDKETITPSSIHVSPENPKTVVLTLPDDKTINKGDTVSISYNDPTNADDDKAIQDMDGNDAISVTDFPVTNDSTALPPAAEDTTPPILVNDGAIVNATGNIELTFNELLDEKNPPKAEDFAVMVGGQPVKATAVNVNGDKVTLTLPTPIKQGEKATVSYNDPTTGNDDTNAIQDKVGNDAATISDQPLINNSEQQPQAEPTTPVAISLITDSQGPYGTDQDGITNDKGLKFDNLVVGKEWEYRINGGGWQSAGVADATSTTKVLDEITATDADGTSYQVEARIKDYTNTQSKPTEIRFDDKTTDPLIAVVSQNSVQGTTEANAKVIVYNSQGKVIGQDKADAFGNFKFDLNADQTFTSGSNYKVSYIDVAGNVSPTAEFAYTNLPRINRAWSDSTNADKHAITVGDSSGGIGNGNIYGLNTKVQTGDGSDALYIKGEVFSGSDIQMGAGDDYFSAGYLSGVAGTPIKLAMGDGNDTVDLTATVAGISSRDSQIDLGIGDDTIRLATNAFGGYVDGGEGYDTFVVTNATDASSAQQFGYLRGFEVIDISGNAKNTLSELTLDNLTNAGQTGNLYIKGDAGDTVNIGNQLGTNFGDKNSSTWSKTTSVREDGVTYDIWHNSSASDDYNVYIQQGINVI